MWIKRIEFIRSNGIHTMATLDARCQWSDKDCISRFIMSVQCIHQWMPKRTLSIASARITSNSSVCFFLPFEFFSTFFSVLFSMIYNSCFVFYFNRILEMSKVSLMSMGCVWKRRCHHRCTSFINLTNYVHLNKFDWKFPIKIVKTEK